MTTDNDLSLLYKRELLKMVETYHKPMPQIQGIFKLEIDFQQFL